MNLKTWITQSENDFKITTTVNNSAVTIYNNSTVKQILLAKFGTYDMMYDTVTDNNNLWNSYIAYVQNNIDKAYNLLYTKSELSPNEITENITITDTYNTQDSKSESITDNKTNTGTDNTTVTDSTSNTTSGNTTNQVYAYNSSDFENSDKNTTSSTSTNSGNITNNNTKNLSENYTRTLSDTIGKTGTVTHVTAREMEDNRDIVKDIIDMIPIEYKYNILDFVIYGFINIGAYKIGGFFDD